MAKRKTKKAPRRETPIDLDRHLPAQLMVLGGTIGRHAVREGARKLGLDLMEWRVIQVVGTQGRSTINQVADRLAMDRGGTSRAIARLDERGILSRTADAKDRRRSLVDLTPKGQALHDDIVRFVRAYRERLLRRLSAKDRDQLQRTMTNLIEEAGAMLAECWSPEH
ncbi:MAG: MarR family transcriptional regulator [Proteobacteria bacterium]|nr:MarR family transcriptional regulator [Pseudomonadota bacterium]